MIAVVFTFIGKDAQDFASRIQRGQAGNGQFNSHAAEVKAVAFRMLAVGQCIEDQIDFTVADHGRDVLSAFMDFANDIDGHAVVVEIGSRTFGSDDVPDAMLRLYRGRRR